MEDQKPFDVRAKLAAELGRTPPEQPKEDYAPKPKPLADEAGLAQEIKDQMRDYVGWRQLTPGEREALDLIATEISRICAGRKFWKELREWASLGLEESDRD